MSSFPPSTPGPSSAARCAPLPTGLPTLVGDLSTAAEVVSDRRMLGSLLAPLRRGEPLLVADGRRGRLDEGGPLHLPGLLLPSQVVGMPASRQLRDLPVRRATPLLASLPAEQALPLVTDSHGLVVADGGVPLGWIARGDLLRAVEAAAATPPAPAEGSRVSPGRDPEEAASLHDLGNALQIAIAAVSEVMETMDGALARNAIEHAVSLQRRLLGRAVRRDDAPFGLDDLLQRHRGFADRLAGVQRVTVDARVAAAPTASLAPEALGESFAREDLDRLMVNLTRNALQADGRQVRVVWNLVGGGAGLLSPPPPRASMGAGLGSFAAGGPLGTLVLEVSDDGYGMADADRARLFARGESASGDRLRGLGLVSVLAILRRYDGRLFVATEEGVGSTFVVSLPLGFRRGAASPD